MVLDNLLQTNLSRFKYLLLSLFLTSCYSKNSEIEKKESNLIIQNKSLSIKNDSLEITLTNIPPKTTTGFIYENEDLVNTYLYFENTSKTNQNQTKKILKTNQNDFIMMFRSFVYINNKSNIHKHDYYINNQIDHLTFDFKNGDVILKNNDNKIVILDEIYEKYTNDYKKNYTSSKATNEIKLKSLENLYIENKKLFSNSNDKIKLAVNELEFLNRLSVIKGNDKRISQYLYNIEKPIWSATLAALFYHNLESIKDSIYKINLNEGNFSDAYKQILPIEVSWHLQQYKDKPYLTYDKNLDWLKKTAYFQSNLNEINPKLKPKNKSKKLISSNVGSFTVTGKLNKATNIKEILQQYKSKYYLLDFWATWCAPCLQNIKTIHNMNLPKDLEIIYVSLDKTKDKEKWLAKSKELNLSNSFLFVENESNKKTLKEMELNELPRYILLDNNFNILNFNLITPQEGDFLKELNNSITNN